MKLKCFAAGISHAGQFPVRGGEAYLTEADPLLRWSVPRARG